MRRTRIIAISVVLLLVLIATATILALLRPPQQYPFVAGATVVRGQEYIVGSQLSREGVYRTSDAIQDVATAAQKTLKPPKWKQTPNVIGKEVKFDTVERHVTLQTRQTGGTTIFIQEFLEPTFSDRVRIWWKKHFGR